MGLLEGGNILYLNVSCGFFVNKKKEIKARGYTGFLKNIKRVTDEYEGKELTKIQLFMKDDTSGSDEIVCISFTEESYYSQTFFARFDGVDVKAAFTVGASNSDQNEKISFCWIKQANKSIQRADHVPKPEKVTVGRNEMLDWATLLVHIDGVIKDFQENNLPDNPYSDDMPF